MPPETPVYTSYHPRWYRQRVSTYWWLGRWSYLVFILRELSSLAVAWVVLLTLLLVRAVSAGTDSYAEFVQWLKTPVVLALNAVALSFLVFHTITWFNAAPRAMGLRLGGRRVPERLVAVAHYAGWAAASALMAWMVLG